jgi:DNA ligase 1
LKIKTFYDAEAEVIGYEPGKGKYTGVTGSLKCKMESGKVWNGSKDGQHTNLITFSQTFRVGTGLSDLQRTKPPKVGTVIIYRFQELTPDGVPR